MVRVHPFSTAILIHAMLKAASDGVNGQRGEKLLPEFPVDLATSVVSVEEKRTASGML